MSDPAAPPAAARPRRFRPEFYPHRVDPPTVTDAEREAFLRSCEREGIDPMVTTGFGDFWLWDISTAVHEAGHAVAAVALGFTVVRVNIGRVEGFHGVCTIERPNPAPVEYLACLAAGGAAQDLAGYGAFRRLRESTSGDERLAAELFGKPPAEAADLYHLAERGGRQLVAAHWPAVVSIARHLLLCGRADGDAVRKMVGPVPQQKGASPP